MNRLNQTESATFSILSFWAFFRNSDLSILLHHQYYLCSVKASINIYNQRYYIFNPWRSFSTAVFLCIHCDIFSSFIWPFSTWVVPVFLLKYRIFTIWIWCLLFKFVFWSKSEPLLKFLLFSSAYSFLVYSTHIL
jgi:hypothetical protein